MSVNRYIHELLQGASARDVVEASEDRKCARCSDTIPPGKPKNTKYCSTVCNNNAQNTKRRTEWITTKTAMDRKCEHCSKALTGEDRSDTRWCSLSCAKAVAHIKHMERLKKDPEALKAYREKAAKQSKNQMAKLKAENPKAYKARKKKHRVTAAKRIEMAEDLTCKSCGNTKKDIKKNGKRWGKKSMIRCSGCTSRRDQGLQWCVTKTHLVPPKIDLLTWEGKAHEYSVSWPECLCTPGNVKPDYLDPSNKYPPRIAFTDVDIPAFNYKSIRNRKRMVMRRYTAGEGIAAGQKAVSKEQKKQGGRWVPGISGGSRKGSSSKNPRRTTQGPTPRRARKPKDL